MVDYVCVNTISETEFIVWLSPTGIARVSFARISISPSPKSISISTYTIPEQNKSTGGTSLPQTTTVTIIPNPIQPGVTAL